MPDQPHQCFSVDETPHDHCFGDEREIVAIHYQKPPVATGHGMTFISVNFPVFAVTAYCSDQRAVAERAAKILNDHWDDDND